jgi:hypothetical protein
MSEGGILRQDEQPRSQITLELLVGGQPLDLT